MKFLAYIYLQFSAHFVNYFGELKMVYYLLDAEAFSMPLPVRATNLFVGNISICNS